MQSNQPERTLSKGLSELLSTKNETLSSNTLKSKLDLSSNKQLKSLNLSNKTHRSEFNII